MIKIQTKQVISVQDWDDLVIQTYGKPYSFQQQNGCQERGNFPLRIPEGAEDFENDTIPEKVNGDERGVSFKAWLARDPEQKLDTEDKWDRNHGLDLFWRRNFYPDVQMIANDNHAKGLIPEGKYVIEINW